MIDPAPLTNLALRGGFTIVRIEFTSETLVDALGRQAIARTRIIGDKFEVAIRAGLSDEELSVTLYHEILEAAAVASSRPPPSMLQFNEGDFEAAARDAHKRYGPASSDNLNRMLQSFGFQEH